jgi:hypothetical protein
MLGLKAVTNLVVRKIPWEFDARVPFVWQANWSQWFWRLALSQTPHHDPADQPLPDWADTWMREYERGNDMTAFYPMPER